MTEQTNLPYLSLPGSGKGPGILVLHAWWGLNDFVRGFCDRLARDGFVVLAPDMFSGRVARTVPEAEHLVAQVEEEGAQSVARVVLSAAEVLRQNPAVSGSGLGVVGISFGGYWSLWLAEKRPEWVRAVTVFYATGDGEFQRSQAAFLGHFAEEDPFEPAEGVDDLERRLREANRPHTFFTYSGTGHWFIETDILDAYNGPAAALAWERTVAFLHQSI
jgi:carboxymethylenebutenolidase